MNGPFRDPPPPCPKCPEHEAEIERLRAQVAALQTPKLSWWKRWFWPWASVGPGSALDALPVLPPLAPPRPLEDGAIWYSRDKQFLFVKHGGRVYWWKVNVYSMPYPPTDDWVDVATGQAVRILSGHRNHVGEALSNHVQNDYRNREAAKVAAAYKKAAGLE